MVMMVVGSRSAMLTKLTILTQKCQDVKTPLADTEAHQRRVMANFRTTATGQYKQTLRSAGKEETRAPLRLQYGGSAISYGATLCCLRALSLAANGGF